MTDSTSDAFVRAFPREPIQCGELDVRPEWIDSNDHMNVGYYMLAFNSGLHPLFRDWFGFGADYIERYGMGPFSMQSHIHYHSELRLGQRFTVSFQLLDFDHKRWHFLCLMQEAETGRLCASLEQLGINVDHKTRRSTPLPEPMHRRFEELMEAHRDLPRPAFIGAPLGIRRKP